MAGWVTRMTQFLNLWAIRIVVLSSFAVQLVLILLAKIRRREAIGWRRTFLWLAYQGASWFATSALGHLTLGRTSREQQLVTFWAPFLLLHLGGPDNISAYSLEDNVLSGRQIFDVAVQLVGVANGLYMLYTHIIMGSDWPLFWASVIMLTFGVGKYAEKSYALWKSDLGSIRSSSKKPSGRFTEPVGFERGGQLGSERALLFAHSLFHICKGAFADYPAKDLVKEGWEKIFSYGWEEMCKVVEIELSLMYDILYTKAAVVHTWFGYGIRVASPLATAAALWLFCLYNKDSQKTGDVVITYILLVATFLLDLGWLLTALGSTWTYAFLNDRPGSWLHHQLLCTRRWHQFRRLIVSLDPCSWLHHQFLCKKPASYRLWSGSIGQYNLLHECTHATTSQWRAPAKKFNLEDTWMEYQYHYSRGLDIFGSCSSNRHVREFLFKQIWNFLYPPPAKVDPRDLARAQAARREIEEALNFDPAFGERILIWHIATDVFLLCKDQNAASPSLEKYEKAIKALSDYMVFLVVVRPNMVPGLKLRSTYEATRGILERIWHKEGSCSSSNISPSCTTREKVLASILRNMENEPGSKQRKPRNRRPPGDATGDSSIVLSDGTKLAVELLNIAGSGVLEFSEEILRFLPELQQRFPRHLQCTNCWSSNLKQFGRIDMQELLELIFNAWVHMLIYASIRCSRDSHAKQLSRGGELTTIVWILVEHAAIRRIRSGS